MSEWQPIETAPKDGTDILLACQRQQYIGERDAPLFVTCGQIVYNEWRELNNHPTDSWGSLLYPTHWMPLPDPPAD